MAARAILVTGSAGFIGSHLVDQLLAAGGWQVAGLDNFDPFYSPAIKRSQAVTHQGEAAYRFIEGDLLDDQALDQAFASAPEVVVHLAAKVGDRPSLADPIGYHRVNVTGTLKLLERARQHGVKHFVLASSGSVYGDDPQLPWKEWERGIQPLSPYAATKLAGEGFAQVYANLHGMKVTALRFFNVHGPRQRPDQEIHHAFRDITTGAPIQLSGDGSAQHDHTFVADVISGVRGAIDRTKGERFEIYNLGSSNAVRASELIAAVENELGKKAIIEQGPQQPGDMPRTLADVSKAGAHFGYSPSTSLTEGLKAFHAWFASQEVVRNGK